MDTFDAILIGTGTANIYLAQKLQEAKKRFAVIEEARFGGSCINYGCTPTKALVAHAKVAHTIRNAKPYGIQVDGFEIDYKAIKARVDKLTSSWSSSIKSSLLALDRCTVFEGHGSFEDAHQVRVNNQLLKGEQIFVDVGTTTHVPKIPFLTDIPYLTNVSLLQIESLPEHLLILGGGYIGLEFAQIYRRLGAKVTVIQKGPRVMPKEDTDISQAIQELLEKEGVEIYTNTDGFEIVSGSKPGNIQARFKCNAEEKKVAASHLFIATGREPNTKNLGLEKAGIKSDPRGYIEVSDALQTSVPHIFALGDCNGKSAFTHTSYNDYEIIAANLFAKGSRKVSDRILIYALFTDPPYGRVGMNEEEALKSGRDLLFATLPMKDVPRAIEMAETTGFLKIIVDAQTKLVLGASFFGIGCDEVIQLIAVAMQAKIPYTLIEKTVLIHPTVSEMLPSLFAELQDHPHPLNTTLDGVEMLPEASKETT